MLDLFEQQGVATPEVVAAAKKMPLGVTKTGTLADSSFPAFLDLVKRQLREDYRDEDLTEEGLRIFTSFDPILQMKSQAAMDDTFKKLAGRKGSDEVESAMVVTNPETGEVQALIGGREAGFSGFNRAIDAVRPIGSLVKPAIYLTALERPSQYTLTSWIADELFQSRAPMARSGNRRTTITSHTAISSCIRGWRILTTCRPPSWVLNWAFQTCSRRWPNWV